MAKATKVQSTKNYSMFYSGDENRPLELGKHRRLYESMKLYGFLVSQPIVVRRTSKGLMVKDGQHRLAIAEELGLYVYYIEEEVDFDVATLNITSVKWTTTDYAQKFANNGIADYQEALDFASNNGVTPSIAFTLLAGQSHWGNISHKVHSGNFRIVDKDFAHAVVGVYVPMVTLAPVIRKATFLQACIAICRTKGFDRKRLLSNAEQCLDKLRPYSTRDAYLEMLEFIYNFRRGKLFSLKNEAIMEMRRRNVINGGKEEAA